MPMANLLSELVLVTLLSRYALSDFLQAEELMRRIEQAEEQLAYTKPNEKVYHLCIVNLVIGTLYCAKVVLHIHY